MRIIHRQSANTFSRENSLFNTGQLLITGRVVGNSSTAIEFVDEPQDARLYQRLLSIFPYKLSNPFSY